MVSDTRFPAELLSADGFRGPVGIEKGQSISWLPLWVLFACVVCWIGK